MGPVAGCAQDCLVKILNLPQGRRGTIWGPPVEREIFLQPEVQTSNNNRMSPINRTRNSLCHAESRNFAVLSLNSGTVTRCV